MLGHRLVCTLSRRQARSCNFCVSTGLTSTCDVRPSSRVSLFNRSFSTAPRNDDDDQHHHGVNPKVCWQDSLHLELPHNSKPLGSPLPFDEHACSVSLPTWSSVVGYEEGDKEVVSAMNCGYPRFVYHPYVLQLMQVFLDKFSSSDQEGRPQEDCLVLPTKEAALRCQAFLQESLEQDKTRIGRRLTIASSTSSFSVLDNALIERPGGDPVHPPRESRIRVEALEDADVYAVLFPAETAAGTEAKAYWQHTGELVSSRRAENALRTLGQTFSKRVTCCPIEGTPTIWHPSDTSQTRLYPKNAPTNFDMSTQSAYEKLQERIAEWTKVDTDNIFLLPSGMATMYKSLRSARRYQLAKNSSSRGGTSIVYGFPYLDTLKMCSRREFSPAGVEFFGRGNATDLELLERLLRQRASSSRWSALFTEVPSNPLLQCPDLEKLRKLADEYDFCMVVDDTIGNFLNVDLIDSGLADAVCTSLTKLVSGRGDAIAGSVILNPNTEKGRWMKEDMARDTDLHGGLHESDAMAMVHNCRDFPERNARINETSELLADFLQEHNDVETVWYPKFVAPLFTNYQKKGGGYGGLMSIHLHSHICQRTFYDTLDVAKGPSLGTNFTLVCPYTLLAHYHELDFAMSYNVPPNLIRIAVGLEDFDELKEKFSYALNKSRLHPKLPR
jgi:cystathionine gamma-synthase